MPQSPDVYWTGFLRPYAERRRLCLGRANLSTAAPSRDGLGELSAQLLTDGIFCGASELRCRGTLCRSAGVLFVCLRADATFSSLRPPARGDQSARPELVVSRLSARQHWPQPDLIPRDPGARRLGGKMRAFFGAEECIANEMHSEEWAATLRDLGLQWHFVKPEKWHDFSEVDVVVAIRDFVGNHRYGNKPPTKLFNAWRAGVPAILGRESAYHQQWRRSLDYLEGPDLSRSGGGSAATAADDVGIAAQT